MPAAKRIEVFDVPRRALYNVVADYESQPRFIGQLVHAEVLEVDGSRCLVAFRVHFIRDIRYVLELRHEAPKRITWTLTESTLLRASTGAWHFVSKGKNRTEVTYEAEVVPRVFVPQRIVNILTQRGLPKFMRSFAEEAQRRLGE